MNSLIVFILLSVQNQSPFTIYNASAGSGKTYTLVKDYLKILFQSKSLLTFRNILALTFTNKAVGEMKIRILETLKEFAEPSILTSSHAMFESISADLNIAPETLHEKSKMLLHTIVHNYAAFDISTIDKFNHKLIRTFAHDLKLPVNFEVELDTKTLLSRAVDKLIDKAGQDKALTKVLVDFAIDKTNEDKSWDITYDFNTISELLVSENDNTYINQLKGKSLSDFKTLKSILQKQEHSISSQIIAVSKEILDVISEAQLSHNDFSGSYLPKHFIKLAEGNFNVSLSSKWQDNLIKGTSIYPKRVSDEVAATIETILPQVISAFLETKQAVFQVKFLKNAINNITPLSVLGAIKNTLEELKKEDDLVLISEFNTIIHNEIAKQPTPFIYERIGEKFKHYFIDEFQDTSKLQWDNLVPLIESAITGENLKGDIGSAMLVGDAKQAIYRWRGGHAEQFIDLYSNTSHPFVIEQQVENLPKNFRSHKAIVTFNNLFFEHLSNFVFTDESHKTIYKHATQDVVSDQPGYVSLSFLDVADNDKDQLYCEAVLERIHKALDRGFSLKDICVIVRRKKEGVAISEFLKEQQIPLVSSETLLLKSAPEINFIINMLTLTIQPTNDDIKIQLLTYLNLHRLNLEDAHEFYSKHITLSSSKMFDALSDYGFLFDFKTILQLPLYESIEAIIRSFGLHQHSKAYLQFFLDEVLNFSQKHNTSILSFLEFWERKKDTLSIATPEGENAIQIMTIHKSKGLEFPVVIFPYANQDLYFDIRPKVWFPVDSQSFNGFSHVYLNINKDMEHYSDTGKHIYQRYRSALELDSINLLYVVLTRAINQLYIVSELDLDKNNEEKCNYYSGLFISYLKSEQLWKEGLLEYSFGVAADHSEANPKHQNTIYQEQFISTAKEIHNLNIVTSSGSLWDTQQEQAIEKGNLIHNIMAEIKTIDDVDYTIDQFLTLGKINDTQIDDIKATVLSIVKHDKLTTYFDANNTIYNERDIITKNGTLLRPDRIVVNTNNDAVIIDYKTGLENSKHKEQLYDYQNVLEDMGFNISKKILIYINNDITIKEL